MPEQNLSMQRIKSVMSETPHLNSNLNSTKSTEYQSKSLNQQLVENVNQFRNYVNHSLAVQCILFVLVVFLVGKLFLPSFRFKSAKNNADVVSETILRIESILENFMDRIEKLEKKIDSNCQQKSWFLSRILYDCKIWFNQYSQFLKFLHYPMRFHIYPRFEFIYST